MDLKYDTDMEIDPNALDVEWLNQPALAMRYAKHGLQDDGQRCGGHDMTAYVAKVTSLEHRFARLAAGG